MKCKSKEKPLLKSTGESLNENIESKVSYAQQPVV